MPGGPPPASYFENWCSIDGCGESCGKNNSSAYCSKHKPQPATKPAGA